MRKLTFLLIAVSMFCIGWTGYAQQRTSPKAEASGTVGGAAVDIVYCRPSADNREIMGALVPYGKVWRTGANAATTISFDKPVKIEGKSIPAGKYALFTIPDAKEWTIIINKDYDQQGAYNYDEKKDVLRVNVKPKKTAAFVETFTITPEKDRISMKWENTEVAFRVKS